MLTEQQILHYVSKQPKHMARLKQLIHDLGLKGRDRRELQQLLREMTRRRKLIAIGKERWVSDLRLQSGPRRRPVAYAS